MFFIVLYCLIKHQTDEPDIGKKLDIKSIEMHCKAEIGVVMYRR